MSANLIRTVNYYVTDREENGFAADNEHMKNASFDTKFFGKNKKVTMQPGLYVLRGAPAAGKTAFLLQMCSDFAKNAQKRIIYYTFKESTRELVTRSLACTPAVNQSNKQTFMKISDCEYFIGDSIRSAFCEYGHRIYFTECRANMTVYGIKASIEDNVLCNVVFIDGLQDLTLMESFAYTLRELKTFQKENNLIVIASFSTAYADDSDKRAIMNYADVIWDLEPDWADDNSDKTDIRLIWAKNRFGFVSDTVYSYYSEYNIFL